MGKLKERACVTCARPHSWPGAELGFEPVLALPQGFPLLSMTSFLFFFACSTPAAHPVCWASRRAHVQGQCRRAPSAETMPSRPLLNALHCQGAAFARYWVLCSPRAMRQGRRQDGRRLVQSTASEPPCQHGELGLVLISCRARGRILLLPWSLVCTVGMPHSISAWVRLQCQAENRSPGNCPTPVSLTRKGPGVRAGLQHPGRLDQGLCLQSCSVAWHRLSCLSFPIRKTGSQPSTVRPWGCKRCPVEVAPLHIDGVGVSCS